MAILNVPLVLVNNLLDIARNAQEVAILYEVIQNSIISAIDRSCGLQKLVNLQAVLLELKEENNVQ